MKSFIMMIVVALAIVTGASAQEMAFQGKWKLIKEGSSDLDYFQYMTIQFTVKQDEVTVVKEFGQEENPQKRWF